MILVPFLLLFSVSMCANHYEIKYQIADTETVKAFHQSRRMFCNGGLVCQPQGGEWPGAVTYGTVGDYMTFPTSAHAEDKGACMIEPFSYQEINTLSGFPLKTAKFLAATDCTQLAYYDFLPSKEANSIVIFYHGGGAYTNAPYQWVGEQLAKYYDIGAYMMDIRGHGKSGGQRGDAPSVDQVFTDITTMINFVHEKHPQVKIFLVGHSSGAGLILNYQAQHLSQLVEGYIGLAPYLGPNSGAIKEQADPRMSFVKKVRTWVYIVAGISGERWCAHIPAVYFNYSSEILADPGMVPYYTYTMSSATTPYETRKVFEQLNKPTVLYIGDKDEQFIPEKVIAYAQYKPELVTAQVVPNAKHLSILLQAPALIAQAVH